MSAAGIAERLGRVSEPIRREIRDRRGGGDRRHGGFRRPTRLRAAQPCDPHRLRACPDRRGLAQIQARPDRLGRCHRGYGFRRRRRHRAVPGGAVRRARRRPYRIARRRQRAFTDLDRDQLGRTAAQSAPIGRHRGRVRCLPAAAKGYPRLAFRAGRAAAARDFGRHLLAQGLLDLSFGTAIAIGLWALGVPISGSGRSWA